MFFLKKMSSKSVVISGAILFVIVNTTYFWRATAGVLSFPIFIFVELCAFILFIILIKQIFQLFREKFSNKQRIISSIFLAVVVLSTFYFPTGLINFEKFEAEDILIAQREGAANCMTTIKLKANKKFIERTICFGFEETKGEYYTIGDTIFFKKVKTCRSEEEYYQFALIKPSRFNKNGKRFDLVRFKGLNDTTGNELWITKNELSKL